MTFAIITWDVNPEIFRIGNFAVRWYGLLFASGFLFGYLLFKKMFNNEGIKEEVLEKLTVYSALGTIIGARLGHCLFYEPSYYLANPVEILKIWQGGLASHGALIGNLLGFVDFCQECTKALYVDSRSYSYRCSSRRSYDQAW